MANEQADRGVTGALWAITERTAARVTLVEGTVAEGDLHLQAGAPLHHGPESPLEMLNREEPFFPLTLTGGGVVFIGKAHVISVLYQQPAPEADEERRTAARVIGLAVTMSGGHEFRGSTVTELPPNHSRPLDFLNLRERFFSVATQDGTVCLNRRHVRVARPID